MIYLMVMFGIAFAFFILFVYCGISLISNLVFGFLEWRIKRRYVNEVLKEFAVLPLKWKEEKLQKWYVLIAIIVCGLIWMPSFVAVLDIDDDVNVDMANVIVNDVDDVIKIEEPLSISEKYGIPEPYYLDVEKGNKNISELIETLKEIKYPHGYEESVFDCSNMASFCEHFLENKGFDTGLSANGTWGHAWIFVYADGRNVNIECIPPIHITDSDSYKHSEVVYQNVYEAMEGDYPYEWDWWLQSK